MGGLCLLGAENGLKLTLNIAEYDYMKGLTTDAGVMVCGSNCWENHPLSPYLLTNTVCFLPV